MKARILLIQSCPSEFMRSHLNLLRKEHPDTKIDLLSAIPRSEQPVQGYSDYYYCPHGKRLDRRKIPEEIESAIRNKKYRAVALFVMSESYQSYDNVISLALEIKTEVYIVFDREEVYRQYDDKQFRETVKPYLNITEAMNEKKEIIDFGPTWVSFFLKSQCNMRCIFCGGDTKVFFKQYQTVDFDYVKNVLFPQLPDVRYINITPPSYGELLFDKNAGTLLDNLIEIKPEHALYDLVTNGALMTKEINKRFVSGAFNGIIISLNAATKATHARLMRGMNGFGKTVENIQNLVREREISGNKDKLKLTMSMIVMRSNIQELPDFVRLASDIGVETVRVAHLVVFKFEMIKESLFFNQDLFNDNLEKAKALAKKAKIRLMAPFPFGSGRYIKCDEPWSGMYVSYGGYVSFCCFGIIHDNYFGVLKENNLNEIWNGPPYRLLRQTVNTSSSIFPSCQHCGRFNVDDIRTHYMHGRNLSKAMLLQQSMSGKNI